MVLPLLPICSVPPLTVVGPVYVLDRARHLREVSADHQAQRAAGVVADDAAEGVAHLSLASFQGQRHRASARLVLPRRRCTARCCSERAATCWLMPFKSRRARRLAAPSVTTVPLGSSSLTLAPPFQFQQPFHLQRASGSVVPTSGRSTSLVPTVVGELDAEIVERVDALPNCDALPCCTPLE